MKLKTYFGVVRRKNGFKKGFMRTLEVVISGLFIVMLTFLVLNFQQSRQIQREVDITKLLYDPNFRDVVLQQDLNEAKNICNEYYKKLNFVCEVKIMDINAVYSESSIDGLIFNLYMFGDEQIKFNKVVRVFLYYNKE